MEFKIEKGVQMPPRPAGPGPEYSSLWRHLSPGDSVFLAGKSGRAIGSTLNNKAMRRDGYRFATRTVTEDGVTGVRVWCLEAPAKGETTP